MSIRQFLQTHSTIVTVILVAATAALIAVAVMRLTRSSARSMDQLYYYDLGTGKLFDADNAPAPVVSESGPDQGVLAMVFSCGVCAPDQRFVGWLENNSEEASRLLRSGEAITPADQEKIDSGRFLAAPPEKGVEPKWVGGATPAAAAIKRAVRDRCEKVTMCTPDD